LGADGPRIYAVSGTQGAGKTTVAAALARRFERGVHIEADTLQKMIVSGREWPEAGVVTREHPEISGEAGVQLRLRLHNACLLARSFFERGFTAVIDDILFGERLLELTDELADLPLHFVMLVPDPATVRAHERERGSALWTEWEWLTESILASKPRPGLWIDNRGQTPEQTVDAIIARSAEARVPVAMATGRVR
jgi:predicted ATPase